MAVPARARAVLGRIAVLPGDQQATLLAAFIREPLPSTLQELTDRAADTIPPSDANQLIRELIGLISLAATHSYDFADVAEAVAGSDGLELDPNDRQGLQALLETLLRSPSVATIGKAVDLYQEQPNVLHTVRLVSDVRPLIGANAATIDGAVVIHHLRLGYFSDGTSTDLDLAIDSDDIEELISALHRAQSKETLLHQFLDGANIPVFNTSAS